MVLVVVDVVGLVAAARNFWVVRQALMLASILPALRGLRAV